jgi:hypothetical protein
MGRPGTVHTVVVEPWAVCSFSVLSGPYRSPPIPLDHLKDLSKGISDDRGGRASATDFKFIINRSR